MTEQFRHELNELRVEIDGLDDELVRLLNRRADRSLRVGELKRDVDAAVFVPERESEVYANVERANRGPLAAHHLRAIWREILSSSRALQRPPRIAYLGPAGTFSHQASLEFFGSSSEYLARQTFPEIFNDVQTGAADCGVVPVENSIEGPVQQNLDLLAESQVSVCGEVTIPVAHFLMAPPGTTLADVERVYAHPQADGQCRRWLATHLPGREVVHVTSNTRAAELAAGGQRVAAISPRGAAEIYSLSILAEHIQDISSNYTRFFVISRGASHHPSGHDKTALCFSIKDRVGALRDVVELFAEAQLNLSSIQSRPSKRRAWEYLFFVEVEGHASDPRVATVLREVEQHCLFLKVLGAWPVPRSSGEAQPANSS